MTIRLGIVVVCCLALTACTPKMEEKGQVVVGQDERGALIAVLGTCEDSERIGFTVWNSSGYDAVRVHHPDSEELMRVDLSAARPPDGWISETWQMPKEGGVGISAGMTLHKGSAWQVNRTLKSAIVDLANVPPLPADADDLAIADC